MIIPCIDKSDSFDILCDIQAQSCPQTDRQKGKLSQRTNILAKISPVTKLNGKYAGLNIMKCSDIIIMLHFWLNPYIWTEIRYFLRWWKFQEKNFHKIFQNSVLLFIFLSKIPIFSNINWKNIWSLYAEFCIFILKINQIKNSEFPHKIWP